ncbi:MAG: helix-turn-helix domain-containing protein [Alphaproteobacteria bacterium]|jgi:CRP/FNR family transcriptional regulator|nr:helix-turn-helix domain-containing protein [Alphaproteobacteria bacterium]MDP6567557.1 helix-turn-helix domain-containing protein [Alphaproteobacteria bacterium]MDP6812771.1 helix-turn-helix domain-containing protein [Alphaproteobacteria bacterium]
MELARPASVRCDQTAKSSTEAVADGDFCRECAVRDRAFCAELGDDGLVQLDLMHAIVNLEEEETLFLEGDDAKAFFTLLSGALRISKLLPDGRRQIAGFLLPGDYAGLTIGDSYTYNAEAIAESTLCQFGRRDIEKFAAQHRDMERRLLAMTNTNLVEAQDHMLLLGRMNPMEKIASFLRGLSSRAIEVGRSSDPLFLPMSRSDIADYLGLTMETVSRTFTRLKRDGVIELPEPNLVRINDVARLAHLTER